MRIPKNVQPGAQLTTTDLCVEKRLKNLKNSLVLTSIHALWREIPTLEQEFNVYQ